MFETTVLHLSASIRNSAIPDVVVVAMKRVASFPESAQWP